MKERKWYLKTYFIAICFFLWFLVIPLPVGIVLLIMQHFDDKKRFEKYGSIDELDRRMSFMQGKISFMQNQAASEQAKVQEVIDRLSTEVKELNETRNALNREVVCDQYNFSDYSGLSSEECKNKLSMLKLKEKDCIKDGKAVSANLNGAKRDRRDNASQIIRCFNAECDNILLSVSTGNIDSMRNKITKSFETLNRIFTVDNMAISKDLLDIKLEELNLVYTYELKREEERQIQKDIRAQMVEEEKERREIEREKAKLEKDQAQFSKEMTRLTAYLQKTENTIEKQLYIDQIRELEQKIAELEKKKETVQAREANARAGYVYIISNIGSFGENIYKIGMTRRLEPMDRIDELSSASVPFVFDVHAMIFSEDAPALETTLHQAFDKNRVNRVNPRKEFFRVNLDEIEQLVKTHYSGTAKFTKIPVAREYNETLDILRSESTKSE